MAIIVKKSYSFYLFLIAETFRMEKNYEDAILYYESALKLIDDEDGERSGDRYVNYLCCGMCHKEFKRLKKLPL